MGRSDLEEVLQDMASAVIGVLKEHRASGRNVTVESLCLSLQRQQSLISRLETRLMAPGEPVRSSWPRAESAGNFRGEFQKIKEGYLEKFKEALSVIMDEEYPGLEGAALKRLQEHQDQLDRCEDVESILPLMGQIFQVFQDYVVQMGSERRRLGHFVGVMNKHFATLDHHIRGLLQAVDADGALSHCAEEAGQKIEQLGSSLKWSHTLEQLKARMEEQLCQFQQLIDERKRKDEARLTDLAGKLTQLQDRFLSMRTTFVQLQKKTRLIPRLEQQALLDGLTEVPNRRAYEQRLREEWARYRSQGIPFSLVVLDLDHFKKVNDTYGHASGDQCLKEIAKRTSQALRDSDMLARYGGEEFVVVLPATSKDDAPAVAERIRVQAEKIRFQCGGEFFQVTLSLGVAQVEDSDGAPEDVFHRADRALYLAKEEGRNRVVVA
ncbi:Diguanylate cyclase, GGDEF domain [Desulfacinum hydrothermale DSM 13146]|uniref:diguanylate cyclase n=1 Tax=Desulfacinum hydrothermale DSM 13146 TaxID=1121390 RepID=A0A1W1XMQ8_9BACT|nr:GGDEF domain-containing protein [Desulfacinum hydrothermale]SMC25270.1 Diguanylate cyclase, GGDEF domain [Desulfacinum hydrothermale DSM 13146]